MATRIQKRGQQNKARLNKLDKDGDMIMDINSGTKGPGRGTHNRRDTPQASSREPSTRAHPATSHGFTGHGHPSPPRGARSTKVDLAAVQTAILRSMGSKDPLPKGPKTLSRSAMHSRKDGKEDGELEHVKIYGLKDSKAASNPGGGVKDLLSFLERKATAPNAPAKDAVRIRKSRHEGDALIISVRPEDMSKVIRLNNYTFAGATLRIEVYNQPAAQANQPRSTEGAGVAELLKGVLSRRYKEETKLMDLSALGSDPELVNVGMFGSNSTTSKFFPALMKVCDGVFTTEQQKTEAVLSVSLANNELTNLDAVTTLAETFPNLRNLDISNNAFKSIQDLSRWRMKFRKLEHLVITGNPMEHGEPTFMAELMKWFPNLRNIGTTQVRTEEEISAAKSRQLPIPTKPASFEDEADIGKNFLLRFFGSYDNDRVSIIRDYYDAQSTYSMSINTSAPRDPASKTGIVSWDRYIKGSRNLCKINHLHARVSREHQGQQSIADAWEKLPRTQHPDLMSEPEKWCIECQPLAGIPDGKTKGGVGGLIITVHGEFKEADDRARTPNTHIQRSFDRVFVLGPGANGGIRVVVDMITLRAYGGYAAFQPDQYGTPTPEPQGPEQVLMRLGLPPHWGSPAQEKTEEQVLKERMALELTTRTGMTIEYSGTCLEENGWDYEAACGAFEGAKANLPQEAFVRFDAWFREG